MSGGAFFIRGESMKDTLAIYVQDHLAGAVHAIELIGSLRDQHSGEPLALFAKQLLAQVEEDRDVLQSLAERIGAEPSSAKELAAWLSEKVTRIKLRTESKDFGTFEALELIGLGIHGKWSLWRALAMTAAEDPRLQGLDFDRLAKRAVAQSAAVEKYRIEVCRGALRNRAA
jgi:hypothetical protein